MKEQMQSVPIQELLTRDKVPVDVYILLGGKKYILVARAGHPVDRLKKYMERGLDRIYMRLSDHPHFMQLVINEASTTASSPNVTDLTKVANLQLAMSSVYREITENGMNESAFNHAKMVNHVTLSLVAKNPKLTDLFAELVKTRPNMVEYSMMVSMMSAMIGVAQEWTKPGTIEKLGLGGFLHEIGRTKLPVELWEKPVSAMTPDELTIYQNHPEIGFQLLMQIKSVPEDVLHIVREHHERADGSGFPRGIKDLQMNPLAKVVALAVAFCDEYFSVIDGSATHKTRIALERIASQPFLFNRDAVKALNKLFPAARSKAA